MFSQPFAEVQVILHTILGDIEQHVIGSLRLRERQSELAQTIAEERLHVSVVRLKLVVITVREAQSDGGCLHQGSRCANSQKIMHLLHAVDDRFWGNHIP